MGSQGLVVDACNRFVSAAERCHFPFSLPEKRNRTQIGDSTCFGVGSQGGPGGHGRVAWPHGRHGFDGLAHPCDAAMRCGPLGVGGVALDYFGSPELFAKSALAHWVGIRPGANSSAVKVRIYSYSYTLLHTTAWNPNS